MFTTTEFSAFALPQVKKKNLIKLFEKPAQIPDFWIEVLKKILKNHSSWYSTENSTWIITVSTLFSSSESINLHHNSVWNETRS